MDRGSWARPSASPGPCPALLSLFTVEGRWWVTYCKGPGERPTLVGRHGETIAAQSHTATRPTQTLRNHPSITGAQTDPPRDTQSYTRGQLSRSRLTCSSSERLTPARRAQALPQAWSTGGEGGPGSGQNHWAELATPWPGCPAAPYHHPGSRVSTGMTLLISADPVPQLLIGPIVCVGVCV